MGLGVNIVPMAFIVMQNDIVKVLPVTHSSALDKLLDYMPDLVEKTNKLIMEKCKQDCKENETKNATNTIIQEN